MDPRAGGAVSRRRILVLGASALGLVAASRLGRAAAAVAPRIAVGVRPAGTGASASVCAACGSPSHSMLGGACLPRRIRG